MAMWGGYARNRQVHKRKWAGFFDSCIKAYRLETKAHGGFYKNAK